MARRNLRIEVSQLEIFSSVADRLSTRIQKFRHLPESVQAVTDAVIPQTAVTAVNAIVATTHVTQDE